MSGCVKHEKEFVQGPLWKPVDNPCGQPPTSDDGSPPHAPPFQENLSLLGRAVEALADACHLLEARCDAIEKDLDSIIAIVDQPIPPAECIERIRQLREELSR